MSVSLKKMFLTSALMAMPFLGNAQEKQGRYQLEGTQRTAEGIELNYDLGSDEKAMIKSVILCKDKNGDGKIDPQTEKERETISIFGDGIVSASITTFTADPTVAVLAVGEESKTLDFGTKENVEQMVVATINARENAGAYVKTAIDGAGINELKKEDVQTKKMPKAQGPR